MKTYPKINIGIGGLVLNKDSEILLIKRKSDPTIWTIPSGYMEINETIFMTIAREVKEETNINITAKGIIGVRQRLSGQEGNNLWVITIADYVSGKIKPDNIEVCEAEFMELDKIQGKQLTPITRQIIKLFQNKELKLFLPQKGLDKRNYAFFA